MWNFKKGGRDFVKLPFEKKHLCMGITAFLTIAASIVFFMIIHKWSTVTKVFALIFKSLRPITYGLMMAYVLNPLVNMFERRIICPTIAVICKKKGKEGTAGYKGCARVISIALAWGVAVMAILALIDLVAPELYSSVESLVISLPGYADKSVEWAAELLRKNPDVVEFFKNSLSGFTTDITEIARKLKELVPNINVLISGVSNSVFDAVRAVLNILIGVIVSVYVLKDKEKFAAQSKRILYSIFSPRSVNKVLYLSRLTNEKFGGFITGKIFDSIIIGILCFILLTIFNVPYSALVSVVVGVTNVIPFFGPFLGAIPSAILILLAEPIKCITFVIIIIALQQFDGNILGPKILGNTIGISSFWVIFSILVGSGLFGVWGMVCAVPIFGVLYTIVRNGCHKSLRGKGIDYSSLEYMKIHHIDEESGRPVLKDE